MKRPRSLDLCLLPALVVATLGAGCVGRNNTLFVTKSNAGFDFDTQPPTTEITISRKEAVITPGFEGGQTPPVMASFKPKTGNGASFKNFFFGVDQTFAGGDAAVAMAALYNRSDAPDSPDAYDSGIDIAKPTYTAWWKRIPGPGETSPFLFSTDTMVGLKIGWNTAAQLPDSLKAGFNRKEFAWAPLSYGDDTTTGSKTTVKLKSPSFLATVHSKARVDGTATEVSQLQYFATGKAATLLALQPDVRRAMLSRMDPSFGTHIGSELLGSNLISMNIILSNLAAEGDPLAQAYQVKLNSLSGITPPPDKVSAYSFDPETGVVAHSTAYEHLAFKKFSDITCYLKTLETNIGQLGLSFNALKNSRTLTYQEGANAPVPLDAKIALQLQTEASTSSADLKTIKGELTGNPDVQAAYAYIQNRMAR